MSRGNVIGPVGRNNGSSLRQRKLTTLEQNNYGGQQGLNMVRMDSGDEQGYVLRAAIESSLCWRL